MSPAEIKSLVVAHYHDHLITVADLEGPRRTQPLAFIRQIAMTLIYEHCELSSTEVGQLFGGRDHGTVLAARKSVNNHASHSEQFRNTLAYLRGRLVLNGPPPVCHACGQPLSTAPAGADTLQTLKSNFFS
jgi:chromosomal replication initiation ATPase DnaA